jgi:Sec-independent protein translocase protein TatA
LAYSRGAGALLASGGADRTVRLWSAPPATGYMVALVHEARAAVKAAEAEDALQQQQQQQYEEGQPAQQQQQQQQQQQAQTAAAAAAAAAAVKPYTLLRTWRTRAAPVAAVAFTPRNLLLAGGAWALQPTTAGAAGTRRL